MKRFLAIVAAFLCITSCACYKDIKINSVELEKVSIFGDPKLSGILAVEIDNPTMTLKVSDIIGVVKIAGVEAVHVTCEPFILEGRSCQVYLLNVSAKLESGFGISKIMKILQSGDLENITADVSVTVRDPLGIKHKRERKDISL